MFSLTDLTSFDLEQLDPTRLDLTRFDLRNVELPSVGLPSFDVPVDATRLAGLARDTAYAGVGVVVTSVKQADAQRRELTDQVTTRVRKFVDTAR